MNEANLTIYIDGRWYKVDLDGKNIIMVHTMDNLMYELRQYLDDNGF